MVLAGCLVEILFSFIGIVPSARHAKVGEITIQWNYTTALNIVALIVAAGLVIQFVRTGGMNMMKLMGWRSAPRSQRAV
jgi:hypothetical protein